MALPRRLLPTTCAAAGLVFLGSGCGHPKAAGATVPVADHVAVVSVTEAQPQSALPPGAPAPRQVVLTQPEVVARLRAAADGLPGPFLGTVNCPADFGTRFLVAFAPSVAASPNISFSTGECVDVQVTVPGQRSTTVGDDEAFTAAYSAVLGLSTGAGSPTAAVGGSPAAG